MRLELWPDSTPDESEGVFLVPRDEGLVMVFERPEGIWVDPDLRRGGVASELVLKADEWAREQGLIEFASDCSLENLVSQAFHLAAGFAEVERSVCYRRSLTPESP